MGAEHFYCGIEAGELERIRLVLQVLNDSPLPVPNMRDIEDHDAIFVLGEDLTQTAARIALSLRQSVKGKAEEMADAMRVQPWARRRGEKHRPARAEPAVYRKPG